MVDSDTQSDVEMGVDVTDETGRPDFDNLLGVITDGFVGALGGFVGISAMTVGLYAASSIGAFDFGSFAKLARPLGAEPLGFDAVTVGYVIFLGIGMTVWPLLLASIGTYLPGSRYALKGLSFGVVLWTGFALVFYGSLEPGALALYLLFTFGAHLAYGFTLGAVFDYFSNRPETLV